MYLINILLLFCSCTTVVSAASILETIEPAVNENMSENPEAIQMRAMIILGSNGNSKSEIILSKRLLQGNISYVLTLRDAQAYSRSSVPSFENNSFVFDSLNDALLGIKRTKMLLRFHVQQSLELDSQYYPELIPFSDDEIGVINSLYSNYNSYLLPLSSSIGYITSTKDLGIIYRIVGTKASFFTPLESPLICAIYDGDEAKAISLIHTEDVDMKDGAGFSILHLAIRYNMLDLATNLIKKGANVNNENFGWTPLHEAVSENNIEGIRLLIEHGANTQIRFQGLTPFDIAKNQGARRIPNLPQSINF